MIRNRKERKAFTMVEIIIGISILAVLAGLVFSKLLGSFQKTSIQSTISTDIETLGKAVDSWRTQATHQSKGGYNDLTVENVSPFIAEGMLNSRTGTKATSATGFYSLGLNQGCTYKLKPSHSSTRYAVLIDCSEASTFEGWSDETKKMMEVVAMSTMDSKFGSGAQFISSEPAVAWANSYADTASTASAAFSLTGGNNGDTKIGFLGLNQ
ncbi:type II secretion system protein [bacterium]|jgi:prepilin-type N-terminal cleavage/methylation domain-containing protein|nr:type II secretion system protein [bacterium]